MRGSMPKRPRRVKHDFSFVFKVGKGFRNRPFSAIIARMTTLVAHNRYRVRGGEDSVFESECRMLEEAGHRVIKYEKSNDSISVDRFERSNVASSQGCPEPANLRTCEPANACGAAGKLALALRTIWNPRTVREVRELIRRERPDVVHCHNTFPLISPSIYHAAAREGVPVVQTLHNYRLACLNGYLFRDGRVCERCLGRSPLRGVCRRCYRGSLSQSLTLAAMLLVHRLLGTWRRKVTRYVALTDFARDKFIAAGLPARKISVKPNAFVASDKGVGLPATVERPGASAPDRQRRVVYVGRLSPEKGVDVLLRAWALLLQLPPSERGVARSAGGSTPCAADPAPSAALPRTEYSPSLASLDSPLSEGADQNARPSQAPGGPGAAEPRLGPAPTCAIIGDGPERAALEGLAGSLGISSSVSFLGAIPREAALRELSAADLLVFPSLWYEQFAITPLEAMALGVPVLVSDVARSGTIIEDGVTGRLFSSGDPAALAAALRDLLSAPDALRRMGAAARAAFESSACRPDRNLARLLSVYASARSAHDA